MFHVPEKYRLLSGAYGSPKNSGPQGAFLLPKGLRCIAAPGAGWEHVSVSLVHRVPNWAEMCFVKSLFWDPEDCVIQYHPPASTYVNVHPYVLHLWRPIGVDLPVPPVWMV